MTVWQAGHVLRLHDRAIRYFDAVRQYGSIREAARQLNVTPSALTRQLAQMEAEIGAPLFDRLPGGMVLTAAGEILARHILTVVQDAARTDEQLAALREGVERHISVMAVSGVMDGLLPRILQRMMERYPRLVIRAESGSPAMIVQALTTGLADVGIAFSLPRSPEVRQVEGAVYPLGVIVPRDHPLADRETVAAEECVAWPFIQPSQALSLHWQTEPLFRLFRDRLRVVMETGSIGLMNRMVSAGMGITIQSPLALESGRSDLVHVPLSDAGATTDLGVYVREGRWLPPSAEVLVSEARAVLAETAGAVMR